MLIASMSLHLTALLRLAGPEGPSIVLNEIDVGAIGISPAVRGWGREAVDVCLYP